MSQTASPATHSEPLQEFSNCHVGILSCIAQLEELPELLDSAARSRQIAEKTLDFFRRVVFEHHAEEERELFPAVSQAARGEEEQRQVRELCERLTREHRQVEAAFSALEHDLKDAAKGRESDLDAAAVASLIASYRRHAQFEEQVLLPLSERLLGRDNRHMQALGVSLHIRHVMPQVMRKFGHRI
jgi:hemerythrin-like domain-containing protein